jgi:hypothetical protein
MGINIARGGTRQALGPGCPPHFLQCVPDWLLRLVLRVTLKNFELSEPIFYVVTWDSKLYHTALCPTVNNATINNDYTTMVSTTVKFKVQAVSKV